MKLTRMRAAAAVVTTVVMAGAACTPGPPSTPPTAPDLGHTFGNAPWNRPVAAMALHPQSAEYSQRLFHNLRLPSSPDAVGQFSVYFDAYSQPVYDARESTGTVKVFSDEFQGSLPDGSSIPWNGAWRPSSGNDLTMHIVDPDSGKTWELWLTRPGINCGPVGLLAPSICVGQADVIQDADGRSIDFHTYEGGYPTGGAWLPDLAMITTATEVDRGVIPHALQAIVYNTMFGPECTPAQRTTSEAGVNCGFYENPANRLEWADGPSPSSVCATPLDPTPAGRSKTVPEGMRFALHKSDAEIEQWLDARSYAAGSPLRNTAKTFAVALRDYGLIITNTSCGGAGIITDGTTNPGAAALWQRNGIPAGGYDQLLYGLLTPDDLYAVAPSEKLVVGDRTPR